MRCSASSRNAGEFRKQASRSVLLNFAARIRRLARQALVTRDADIFIDVRAPS